MHMYKFQHVPDVEELLLNSLGVDLILESPGDNLVYFHNGDKMTVNTATGEMCWEPIEPGSMSTSKLALRFHQWWGKGLIRELK